MVTVVTFAHAEITLDEVKAFVRVDTDAHDALLAILVAAAQEECFAVTHTVFGTAEFLLKRFQQCYSIDMPYGPIATIDVVELDGVAAVLDTDYNWQPPYLNILTPYTTSVHVEYTCTATLPADVKHAILQRVKYGFDYGDDLPQNGPRFFDRIIGRYRHHQTFAG
jgi:hypothetical protein